MNETDQAFFSTLINQRLLDLRQENGLGRDGQKPVILDQQSVGRLSRMDALQNQAIAKATQARRDILARRLNAALRRIAEGEFGYCEDCGDKIARKRLELDPAAAKCISCATG